MESIILYSVVGLVLIINAALFILLKSKLINVLRTINRVKVDINNPYLPDYVIHKEQAIRFPVGKKFLYLKPMAMASYTVFIENMVGFFTEFKSFLDKVNMDKDLKTFSEEDITALMGIFKNPEVRLKFLETLKDTILLDPEINADKVKWKELVKMDISSLIQLFIVMYDRNVTCVRSFIASLLARLGEGSAKQKPGLGLWSLQDSQWMLSQLSQSLKHDLSSLAGPKEDSESKTQLIEI